MSEMRHFRDSLGFRFHILEPDDYWFLYSPLAKILPESIDIDVIVSELNTLQRAFIGALPGEFVDCTHTVYNGEYRDFYFPGHSQKIRLMYIYVLERRFFARLLQVR